MVREYTRTSNRDFRSNERLNKGEGRAEEEDEGGIQVYPGVLASNGYATNFFNED